MCTLAHIFKNKLAYPFLSRVINFAKRDCMCNLYCLSNFGIEKD